jgi:hypothetical protein
MKRMIIKKEKEGDMVNACDLRNQDSSPGNVVCKKC